MAQTRKQQSEIERVLKRVQDGLIEFESIWQKVYSAPTAALKEKHEADLKKEIKRLQRYRDQIKTWLSTPEIREKEEMFMARKQIERDMERFKVCEKETKTKAFSKEALTNTPKKKLLDKPKLEVKSWIDKRISLLKGQLGERESQLDAEQRRGKKRNKGHEEVHVDHLQRLVERYKFHIEHLEMAWEMLFEDEIVVADVEEIQEDVDYFIENNQDEDMEDFDDAYMYDLLAQKRNAKPPPPPVVFPVDDEEGSDFDLGSDEDYDSMLDDDGYDEKEADDNDDDSISTSDVIDVPVDDSMSRRNTAKKHFTAPVSQPSPTVTIDTSQKDAAKEKPQVAIEKSPIETSSTSKSSNLKSERDTPKKAPKKKKEKPVVVVPVQISANYQEPSPQQVPAVRQSPLPPVAASGSPKQSPRTASATNRSMDFTAVQQPPPAPFANIVKQQQQKQQAEQAAASAAKAQAIREQSSVAKQQDLAEHAVQEAPAASLMEQPLGLKQVPLSNVVLPTDTQPSMLQSLHIGVKQQFNAGSAPHPTGIRSTSPLTGQPPPGLSGPSKSTLANKLRQKRYQAAASEEPAGDLSLVRPSRLAAVQAASNRDSSPMTKAPPPQMFDAPLSEDQRRNLEILESSLRHMPTPADSDRPKHYLPRNPYHTPSSWPSIPSPIFEEPAFFEKYDTDTLFFIFYFQQGTYQQYLAAAQLKKQSWRYHTKYLTWFQRHKDPQVTTDEFEQGTYVYFDYDHSWCQRIKSEFTFEYRYLEDDL